MPRLKSRRHAGSVQHGGYRRVPANPVAADVTPLLKQLRRALDDRHKPIDHAKVQRLEEEIDRAFGM